MCPKVPHLPPINVADRLAKIAARMPETLAVVNEAQGVGDQARVSFATLDHHATAIARGFVEMGVTPGTRLVLLVPPSVAMVTLVFGLLRSGATTVLIDPGMGRRHLIRCLAAVRPQGFVAISPAQAVRCLLKHRFPQAKINLTVGRRWFWSGPTYEQCIAKGQQSQVSLPTTRVNDPAAIIYTSGSTGPPKGVLYTHQMFDTQAEQIQQQYDIQPGAIDLACFALFGLFNSAMGVTTIFPDIDFSRPATADPKKLLAAANQWQITQAFASPAVWDKLSRYCEQHHQQIPTLRKVLSCGAPVPAKVLQRTLACIHPSAEMHTPYGATECLPIATIGADEVLAETVTHTNRGAGVCVGRKFACGEWRVIRTTDKPLPNIDQVEILPTSQIGELIVHGPQVSPEYVCAERQVRNVERVNQGWDEDGPNALAKIEDGKKIWHRLGDVGYFDEQQRFWYCGRKAHRVKTDAGTLYSVCCEAIFNQHPQVRRSALVGIGSPGAKMPLLIVETVPDWPAESQTSSQHTGSKSHAWQVLIDQLKNLGQEHEMTRSILHFLWHPSLPVDVRHNAKINREQLTEWATEQPIVTLTMNAI